MKRFSVLSALICMCLFIFSASILAEDRKDNSVKTDKQAPVITIKSEDNVIRIVKGKEFNLKNYVAVSDNSDEFHLTSTGEVDVNKVDDYTLDLVAIDAGGNTSSAKLVVKVITQETMDEIIALEQERLYEQQRAILKAREDQRLKERAAIELSSDTSESAYDLALSFVGMTGQCTDVAQAFINSYFGQGYSIFDTYEISPSEAMAGDIIYYPESGLGTQHYAVYLGGESALHGNFNGLAKVRSIYLRGGSNPIFYRLSGR